MDDQVAATDVILRLQVRLGALETEKAVLQLQLEARDKRIADLEEQVVKDALTP